MQVQLLDRRSCTLLSHQCRCHILQVKGGEAVQLLVDALEDVVVQVPRLVGVCRVWGGSVCHMTYHVMCIAMHRILCNSR